MKQMTITVVSVLLLAGWVRAGTIVYLYDEQNRLVGANYDNQATQSFIWMRNKQLSLNGKSASTIWIWIHERLQTLVETVEAI